MRVMRRLGIFTVLLLLVLTVLLLGPTFNLLSGRATLVGDWSKASRHSAGIAPDAARTPEAIVQVFAARAFRWKGAFAVHSWIAVKPENAPEYITYEVVGWYIDDGTGAIQTHTGAPDRHWYGAKPQLLGEIRGPEAKSAIKRIQQAVESYPYKGTYRSWPGPNSNSFVAYILRRVPELQIDLPPTAIGKDFLGGANLVARAPSRKGVQFSLYGVFGALLALEEGIEFNLLGLSFGIDPGDLALRLPGFGLIKP